jgi:hypothetical protein
MAMRKSVIVLCAVFLIYGCSGMYYGQRYDPDVNFGQLKTFSIMPLPEKKGKNTVLLLKNLRFAVDKELQARGFTKEEDDPDFLVALHVMTRRAVDMEQYGYSYSTGFYDHPYYLGRHGGYGRHDYGYTGPEIYEYRSGVAVYEYTEGTLVVDIVSADKKELIWRGTSEGVLEDNLTQEYIRDIVAKILKVFPPPALQ